MESTTTQKPGDVVRRFYDLLAEGKVEDSLQLIADDVTIHESAALPYGGEYHGVSGMRELLSRMEGCAALSNVGGIEYIDTHGEQTIVRMGMRATNRTSGKAIDTQIAEIYTVRHGKVVDVDVYYRDPTAITEIAVG